jgi:hypothetical protein
MKQRDQNTIDRIHEIEAAMGEELPLIARELLAREARSLNREASRILAHCVSGDCEGPEDDLDFQAAFHARDAAYRASRGFSPEQQAECRWEARAMGETDSPWY